MAARFSAPAQTDFEAHPSSCTLDTESVPGGKEAGGLPGPPKTSSSAEVKGRIQLYFYAPMCLNGMSESRPAHPCFCGAANFGKIWSACEQHEIHYTQ